MDATKGMARLSFFPFLFFLLLFFSERTRNIAKDCPCRKRPDYACPIHAT
jgi:hypothetical protein